MARLLVTVIALCTLCYLGYWTMYKDKGPAAEERSAPKRQLENVREKARQMEQKSQQNADAIDKRMNE